MTVNGVSGRLGAAESDDTSALAARTKVLLAAGEEAGASEIFGELVSRLQHRASRLAHYYLRDHAEADEAVQDAFVKAYWNLGTYREERPFEAWFTRILVNGCLDRLKARRRRWRWLRPLEHEGPPAVEAASVAESPEEAVLREEARGSLRQAIEKLPLRQREVVVLSHLDGRTTKEIAQLTGMREPTVRVHLFRAARKLRKTLEVVARRPDCPE